MEVGCPGDGGIVDILAAPGQKPESPSRLTERPIALASITALFPPKVELYPIVTKGRPAFWWIVVKHAILDFRVRD